MVNPRSIYILDSFALLAHLHGETSMARVDEILQSAQRGDLKACMSMINLGEVLYITERQHGLRKAQDTLALIQQMPVEILPADEQAVLAAAHIKANYPISYADAFTVAAAQELSATILTGDSEFGEVESIVKVEWLKVS